MDDNSTVKLRLEEFSKEYPTGTKHIQRVTPSTKYHLTELQVSNGISHDQDQ